LLSGHPVFWLLLAAVAAPLLAEIPLGFRVPVVVLEVVLGIVIGPHVLGLVRFEGFVAVMFTFGMATTLFMAGMELDFGQIRGRPLSLAALGWITSVLLGFVAVGMLHVIPQVHAPLMVTLALCTTGLGILIPIFRDGGQLDTPFGRLFVAAGTLGEVGPIVAMSLLLSQQYSTWQEIGFLLVFLAIVGVAAAVGIGARPPRVLELLSRTMHSSSQLPVRISLLLLVALFVLAEDFGFESIFGAFAAGMIVGLATRGADGDSMRAKLDAVCFGWFYPFFFVGTGIKFDIAALGRDVTTMLLVPAFLVLFLVVRGAPILLYRNDIAKTERLPFALSASVASLSIIVVITEIGVRARAMTPDIAAALVGAALLSVLLFPTIAGGLLSGTVVPSGSRLRETSKHSPPQ
jgi:Kef-type K+ transport system membrane component KefB